MKQSLIDGGVDVDSIGVISAGYPCQEKVLLGSEEVQKTKDGYGQKSSDLLKNSGPLGLLEKMLLDTSRWAWTPCSPTWKKKTTRQGRLYFRLSVSARRIKDTGHLLLATPTTSQNYKPIRELCPSEANGKHGKTLPGSIGEHFPEHIGKKINPQFVEWMMGLPQDWTKID